LEQIEIREQAGDTLREHGLADTWRAMEQHVVPTRRGYFAGPLSLDLTDHICQVKTTVRMPTGPLSYYLDGLDRWNRDAAQKGDQLSDGGNTKDFNAINKLRLPGLTQCHDHPAKPAC
jgi:hypothetical protein